MPYKASRVEQAYRIAQVPIMLLNDQNVPEEVTLNVKYRPLSMQKLQEWEAIERKFEPEPNGQVVETPKEKKAREAKEKERAELERDILAFQLSEVVFDLDLTEDDGITPKKVTTEYLKTLDLGFLKDIKDKIEERAFPEKKLQMALIQSRLLPSST